jgi:hypothetical protein
MGQRMQACSGAGSSVGASTHTELDLAAFEVAEELVPLGVGGLPVLLAGPRGAPAGDEGPVVLDDLVVVDGDVGLRGGQRLVAEELGGDMDRKAGGHRLGGEDAPEIVRREAHRPPVGPGDPGGCGGAVQELLDPERGQDGVGQTPGPLEEERKRRAVEPLGLVVARHQRQLLPAGPDPADDGDEHLGQLGG